MKHLTKFFFALSFFSSFAFATRVTIDGELREGDVYEVERDRRGDLVLKKSSGDVDYVVVKELRKALSSVEDRLMTVESRLKNKPIVAAKPKWHCSIKAISKGSLHLGKGDTKKEAEAQAHEDCVAKNKDTFQCSADAECEKLDEEKADADK